MPKNPILFLSLVFFTSSLFALPPPINKPAIPAVIPTRIKYKIIHRYPHDTHAFTQGLVFANDYLFESTGKYGQSSLKQILLENGQSIRIHHLPQYFFAEGLTFVNNHLIQISWKSKTALIYNFPELQITNRFHYNGWGWGLAFNGQHLVMSDGTNKLYFYDPDTFKYIKNLSVMDQQHPVTNLNELEYYKGTLLANIWKSSQIAQINLTTGKVLSWINLDPVAKRHRKSGVLNGIAFDDVNDRLFVTGKFWPWLYEIKLITDPKSK